MKNKFKFYLKRIREGRLKEMARETIFVYSYARHYWKAMIVYTLLGLTGTVVSLLSGFVSRDLVDIITGHQTGVLLETFCMMIAVAISSQLITMLSSYFTTWVYNHVNNEVRADIFKKLIDTDWEALSQYHTGDLMTRWNSDSSTISNGILSWLPNVVINFFKFVSALGVVLANDASFAVFALLGIPVSLIMSKRLLTRMQNNNKRSMAMSSKMSGFNQEAFSNIQTLKAFDLLRLYVDRLKQLQKEQLDMQLEFSRMSMATSFLMSLVGLGVSYACYGWGIYRVWQGAITYGTMTMFLTLASTLTGSVNSLANAVPQAITITTSAGRLMEILDMPQEDYSKLEEAREFGNRYGYNGMGLKLTDISYHYHNGDNVFSHANLQANPHEIIALIGPSGEGKTTMMRLLLSLIKPQSGEAVLTADDQTYELSPSVRQFFSYVPQGNTMFSGTIAYNMRQVKPDISNKEIIENLKMAEAWDFVKELPGGIDYNLQERGGGISEGQAQRLSIARALIRKSPVLLLDEATSALDPETERRVLKNILKDDYPRTCIVTTHRMTVLNQCTRVYELKNKQCVELSKEEISAKLNLN